MRCGTALLRTSGIKDKINNLNNTKKYQAWIVSLTIAQMMNSKETYKRFPNREIVKSNLLRQKIMIFTISWHRRLTKWRIQYNLFRKQT